jgi:16S rRNA processing protein RimM
LSKTGEELILPNLDAWVKLANDEFLPVIIEKVERLNSQYLLKFKNYNSADDAIIFQNSELLLKEEFNEEVDQISPNIYLDYEVFNMNEHKIGKVLDVHNIPGNPLLLILMDNKEVMIPIADEFIQLFDNENRKIIIQNYEGLLDI